MKKRLEQLVCMGILSMSIVSNCVYTYAQEQETVALSEAKKEETEKETVSKEEKITETPITETPVTEQPTEVPTTESPSTELPSTEGNTESETGDGSYVEKDTAGTSDDMTEKGTEDSTENDTENNIESGTESSSDPSEESTEDETVEIIDNSMDDEQLEKIQKAAEKKNAEFKKKLYEQCIGESVVDFSSYPAGNITENTNWIYDYLIKELGLNHAAACGVLANIQCESNFTATAVGDGGTSYGLCQWHLERFVKLVNWCQANGYDYHLVEGQMNYLKYELSTFYVDVYAYILQVPDTEQGAFDAAYYWCAYFEIPADTIARANQRGNMAVSEFYPKELGLPEEVVEVTEEENEEELDLWAVTLEYVYQMYRLNIPMDEVEYVH